MNVNLIVISLCCCATIIYCVNIFLSVYKKVNTIKINSEYTYEDMKSEFFNYSLSIITRMVLERMLKSESDVNGSKLALAEISHPSEPFYQGVIITIIGSMSEEMKRRFYTFYNRTKNDRLLVTTISSIIESYSMLIVRRIRYFENEVIKLNHEASKNNKKLIDSREFINGKIIDSIVFDVDKLNLYNNTDVSDK